MKKTYKTFALFFTLFTFSFTLSNAQTYFSDNFETGMSKWTRGGGNWDTLSTTYNSTNHCITDSRVGNYAYNSDPTITKAQSMNLTNTTFPVLTFYHKYSIWNGGCSNDNIYLEVSTNGGFNWTQIKFWQGSNRAWTHEQINLSNYKFNLVKIRFRLSSHNGCSYTDDGWYIDDIKVQESISANPTFAFPFCDDFENGKSKWLTGGFNWDTSSTNPNSGQYCITDSKIGNYTYNSDPTFTMSGVLNLSNTIFPVLTFYHRYSIWNGGCSNDNIYVELSTDGGFNWILLQSFQGSNVAWTYVQYDLSSYRTDRVKFRYRLSSHNGCGYNADGAYLDDVCIYDLNPNYINLNLKVLLEGMYDTGTNEMARQDTFKVYLRNVSAPYSLKDSAKGVISPFSLSGQFYFKNAPTGNYFIVVKHRNSIETWSKSGGEHLVKGDGSVYNYDFTTASCQAYGCNQILKGTKYCIYSGDINQDGIVDATDIAAVENGASAGISGYVPEDLNGDFFVDGSDLSIVENNSSASVSVMRP